MDSFSILLVLYWTLLYTLLVVLCIVLILCILPCFPCFIECLAWLRRNIEQIDQIVEEFDRIDSTLTI
jgi:hypothetical protein